MDKQNSLASRERDTVWKKDSYCFYKTRYNQSKKVKNQLLYDKHKKLCHLQFNEKNLSQTDIQTFFAGINIQNLFGMSDLIITSDISLCIRENKLGISYKNKLIGVNDLTDLYRWSNIIKSIGYKLSESEKETINDYGKRILKNKNLRTIYEWIISSLNIGLPPDKSLIKEVLSKFSNENNLFFRHVRDKKRITSDSLYNGLVLQKICLGEIPNEIKTITLKCLDKYSYPDGFRSSPNHHPNIWSQYDYLCCLHLLGYNLSEVCKKSIISYILSCQCPRGGFYSSIHGKSRTLLKTSAALISLKMLDYRLHGQFHVLEGCTLK